MYVLRNIEAPYRNHCCCTNALCVTHSEYVFVALGIHHTMGMRQIVIRGLSGSTIFFHVIPQSARF